MTNNIAVLEGFTKDIALINGEGLDLYLLIQPETDLDDRFKAWDTDGQEFIMINGWLFGELA